MPIAEAWSFSPLPAAGIAVAAFLYARRARTLAARGRGVPRRRAVAFAAGLAVVALALLSPLDRLGEERLFSAHMLQHLLLGDLGALLLVLGLDGRLLRPLLAVRGVGRLRVLVHPLVALPLWAANFTVWHLPPLYDAALGSGAVHALQHGLFLGCGVLVWAALLEPLPGPVWFSAGWKLPYVLGMWLVMLVLSQVFLWSEHVYYEPYLEAPRTLGLDPLADQQAGGGVMLVESAVTMIGALVWLFLRLFAESEARQQLLDAGADPAAAARAARYGRG